MPGMGGDSGGGGGMVVGGPSQEGSYLAGMYQQQAAAEAASQAREMTNQAINAINQNYQQARHDVQPYRSEGVQALDQLNQYIGLEPYNPGTAPVAPTAPNLQDIAKKLTRSQMASWVQQNSSVIQPTGGYAFGPNNDSVKAPQMMYNGEGSTMNGLNQWNPAAGAGALAGYQAIREAAAQPLYDQQLETYNINKPIYDQNLGEYNQNLDWYNKYKAEGPLTQSQVTDKITNQPGYQAELSQGLDAIQKNQAARGLLGSGGMLKELMGFGQGTLSKYYDNTLNRLQALTQQGQQAATSTAGISMNQGNATAGLYQGLGDTLANSSLASGNAMAQAALTANQQYKVIGGGGGGGGGLGGLGSVLGGIGSILAKKGTWSSKELKDKISTPSTEEILQSVKDLELDIWKYKDTTEAHIGPYAEDFKEKFNVGTGKTINVIDAFGVLFASVQELAKQVERLQEKL